MVGESHNFPLKLCQVSSLGRKAGLDCRTFLAETVFCCKNQCYKKVTSTAVKSPAPGAMLKTLPPQFPQNYRDGKLEIAILTLQLCPNSGEFCPNSKSPLNVATNASYFYPNLKDGFVQIQGKDAPNAILGGNYVTAKPRRLYSKSTPNVATNVSYFSPNLKGGSSVSFLSYLIPGFIAGHFF